MKYLTLSKLRVFVMAFVLVFLIVRACSQFCLLVLMLFHFGNNLKRYIYVYTLFKIYAFFATVDTRKVKKHTSIL